MTLIQCKRRSSRRIDPWSHPRVACGLFALALAAPGCGSSQPAAEEGGSTSSDPLNGNGGSAGQSETEIQDPPNTSTAQESVTMDGTSVEGGPGASLTGNAQCQASPALDLTPVDGTTQVTVPATDLGIFVHGFRKADGQTEQSYRELMNTGEHQTLFTGSELIFSNTIVAERRAYLQFDIPPTAGKVTRAALRLWGWQPAEANGRSGVYYVRDANNQAPESSCETLSFYPVERHDAASITSAQFDDPSNHEVDLPIWEDLGDGPELGSRQYSEQDMQDVAPSPTASDPNVDCSEPNAPCGKWLDHELNDVALEQLTAAAGSSWMMGAALSTLQYEGVESVHRGSLADLNEDKMSSPDFRMPLPELVLFIEPPSSCTEASECDDGNPCNGPESCDEGTCQAGSVAGPEVPCGEGQFCDGSGQCLNECAVDADCATDACRSEATCEQGACVFSALDCDDDNACTADSCDPATGCVNEDTTEQCVAPGQCQVGSCDAATGCLVEPVADGTACLNGDGECSAGVCTPTGVLCPDGQTPARQVVVDHSFRGAYNSVDVLCQGLQTDWKVVSGSYQVRALGFAGVGVGRLTGQTLDVEPVTRSYFTFDTAELQGQVVGASLLVEHPANSISGDANGESETVTLYSVDTASAQLQSVEPGQNGGSNPEVACDPESDADLLLLDAIFSDLGSGTVYGQFEGTESDNGTVERIELTPEALQSINAAAGLWSVGADLTSPGDAGFGQAERVWRGSGDVSGPTQLAVLLCD